MSGVICEVFIAALTALGSILVCRWLDRGRSRKTSKLFRPHPEVERALDSLCDAVVSLNNINSRDPRTCGDIVEVSVAEDMDHNRETLDRHEAKIAEALVKLESAAAALRETRARVYTRKKPIDPNGSARIKLV